jgi:SAM-dependent methyltransferase
VRAADRFGDQTSRQIEALYATPDVAAQRSRILAALQLGRSEKVADIGCGPGYLTAEIAEAVGPAGLVHGLDLGPAMVAIAERRCAGYANCRVEVGDARALPFPDATFDALASIQVLEHVDDVATAIDEMARVLRPGGRAVVMATDWDSLVMESGDRARLERVVRRWERRSEHAHLPSRLGPLLGEAGLAVEQIAAVPMLNTVWDEETYAVRIVGMIHNLARRRGDPAEADGFFEEQRRLGAEGRFFFCLNRFLFVARQR